MKAIFALLTATYAPIYRYPLWSLIAFMSAAFAANDPNIAGAFAGMASVGLIQLAHAWFSRWRLNRFAKRIGVKIPWNKCYFDNWRWIYRCSRREVLPDNIDVAVSSATTVELWDIGGKSRMTAHLSYLDLREKQLLESKGSRK